MTEADPAVAPDPIATSTIAGDEAIFDVGDMPIPRFGTPEDVAYLTTPECSFVTGTCLHVGGGLVLA
jgi:NAD(P)-dependent dehydrogenase (short-subunit alcohol dehydrogenase family)